MMKCVPLLALAALILVGCNKSGSTGASTAADAKKSYVGKWVGNPEVPKTDKQDRAAEMAAGMMKMMGSIQLEFVSESKFKMIMFAMPIEGKVTQEGDILTLTPETLMGMTPDEAKKDSSMKMEDKPIKLKLSADGTKLSSIPEKPEEPVLVFERGKPEPKHETTMTDTGDLALVGDWGGVIEMPPLAPDATEAEKDEHKMTEQMGKSVTLDVHGDGTFKLDMMVEIEGKWKREGSKITMTPTKMMGMEMTEEDMKKNGNEPMVGEITDGDKTITVLHKDPKKGRLILKKK